jgi:hypothetical protein
MTGRWGRMRQPTTAEVRLDEGRATSSGAVRPSESAILAANRLVAAEFRCVRLDETENRTQQLGYPGDVGLVACSITVSKLLLKAFAPSRAPTSGTF